MKNATGASMTHRDHSDVSYQILSVSLPLYPISVKKVCLLLCLVSVFSLLVIYYEHSSITKKSIYISERSPQGRVVGEKHVDTDFWEILYQTMATLVSQVNHSPYDPATLFSWIIETI